MTSTGRVRGDVVWGGVPDETVRARTVPPAHAGAEGVAVGYLRSVPDLASPFRKRSASFSHVALSTSSDARGAILTGRRSHRARSSFAGSSSRRCSRRAKAPRPDLQVVLRPARVRRRGHYREGRGRDPLEPAGGVQSPAEVAALAAAASWSLRGLPPPAPVRPTSLPADDLLGGHGAAADESTVSDGPAREVSAGQLDELQTDRARPRTSCSVRRSAAHRATI